jgi:hypothetical protein
VTNPTKFASDSRELTLRPRAPYTALFAASDVESLGQVAQSVERGPEKAGVGGSIPSLAM